MMKWRKSSYSNGGGGGSCVEVATTLADVRDSKNPNGPALRFQDRGALTRLVAAIKRGEL
jgi:hypothetical protein